MNFPNLVMYEGTSTIIISSSEIYIKNKENKYVINYVYSEYLLFSYQAGWVLKSKIFGQKLTVVKWNYQILWIHPLTVQSKLDMILLIKWFKKWSYQKSIFTKQNHYQSRTFWRPVSAVQWMALQNKVVSFEFIWFLSKNVAF